MLQYSAYLYDQDLDDYNVALPFLVHSCGKVSADCGRNLNTDRQNGRRDFQIIYIHQGKGHFILDNRETVLDEGCTVLYYPLEVQQYFFRYSENAQFYWLHFSGTDIPGLLREAGLDRQIIDAGMASYIPSLFEGIIRELIMKQPGYLQLANLKGQELVWLLAREARKQASRKRSWSSSTGIMIRISPSNNWQEVTGQVQAGLSRNSPDTPVSPPRNISMKCG